MKDNKMALGGAKTPGRAALVVNRAYRKTTTSDGTCQLSISDLLRHGNANPTSCRELASILHWQPREITRAIEAERRQGKPIVANSKGYFIPANDCELERYLASLHHREREIRRTRDAVAATRQQAMNLWGVD